MKNFHDPGAYERRELRITREIIRSIIAALQNAGFRDEKLKSLTEEIAFSVTEAVGSTHIDLDDDHLVPILGFAEGRMRDRLLIPECGGSSLHEYVFGISNEFFSNEEN